MPKRTKSQLNVQSRMARYHRLRAAQESAEQRAARLESQRHRTAACRRAESQARREARLEKARARTRLGLARESAEQRAARLEAQRQRTAASRRAESPARRAARLADARARIGRDRKLRQGAGPGSVKLTEPPRSKSGKRNRKEPGLIEEDEVMQLVLSSTMEEIDPLGDTVTESDDEPCSSYAQCTLMALEQKQQMFMCNDGAAEMPRVMMTRVVKQEVEVGPEVFYRPVVELRMDSAKLLGKRKS